MSTSHVATKTYDSAEARQNSITIGELPNDAQVTIQDTGWSEEEQERIAKADRERRDKALLATYATLADFDRVRDRALAVASGEIQALKKSEASETEKLTELKKQVDPNSKRPVAPKLKSDIETTEKGLRDARIERGLLYALYPDRIIIAPVGE